MSKYNLSCGAMSSPYTEKKAKRAYPTLIDAIQASQLQLSRGNNQRPYKCKGCDQYHLTSSGQRKFKYS